MAPISNTDYNFYLVQMVELMTDEVVFRERLASFAVEAIIISDANFVKEGLTMEKPETAPYIQSRSWI
jgi:hypothetical protein